MNDDRLTNLEIKYSHLEDYVQDLNKVVVEQQTVIKRLEKEILDLKRNVNQEPADAVRNLKDEKPPHY